MGPLFRSTGLPKYHDGMLMVQVRTDAGQPAAPIAGAMMAGTRAAPTAGMSALSYYERAGLLRRVTPIRRARPQFRNHMLARFGESVGDEDRAPFPAIPVSSERSGLAAAALVGSAAEGSGAPGDGLSLIELQRDEDVRELQLALASDPTVASVSKVPVRYLCARAPGRGRAGIAAVPPPPASMWNLAKVRWAQARGLAGFSDAKTIKVAVLDTGIDRGHPDLGTRVVRYIHEHLDLPLASSEHDIIGHGTHVAGTIAALVNDFGINGICECELHIWKIFDDQPDLFRDGFGGASFQYFVDPIMYRRALLDCVDANIDVVNLSIGGEGAPDAAESAAFSELIANGTTVVAAMGNAREFGSPIEFPGAIPGVIAVGATTIDDRVTNFSNAGNHISICAPGEAIWSTLPQQPGQTAWEAVRGNDNRWTLGRPFRREVNYDAWPGTSMASPHVAAAAALILANGGKRSAAAVRQVLIETADKVERMNSAAFHPDYGFGRLNLERAVERALSRRSSAAPQSVEA